MYAIREADESDLPYLPALEAAADTMFKEAGLTDLPAAADAATAGEATMILVAGRPPVGFAKIEEIDGLAHLEQLSVAPDQGRQGIGTQLLEAACDWATRHGYDAMTLCTFRDIPWNAPFYARHGFVVIDALTPGLAALRQHEFDLGLDVFGPRVVMRRSLV